MPRNTEKRKGLPLRIYKNLVEIMAKVNMTYHNLVEENKNLGIPTPFSLRGNIYYLMPDGRIVLKR